MDGKHYIGDPVVGGRIILKLILNRMSGCGLDSFRRRVVVNTVMNHQVP
jgi:hypothetical protein